MKRIIAVVFCFVLIFSACSPQLATQGNTALQPSSTVAASTATVIPTQTPAPTATETPLPTSTPTLSLPVHLQTPVPVSPETITWDNFDRLVEVATLGEGNILGFDFSHDGSMIAVNTVFQLEVHRTEDYGLLCVGSKSLGTPVFSEDDRTVIAYQGDGSVTQLDVNSCKESHDRQIKFLLSSNDTAECFPFKDGTQFLCHEEGSGWYGPRDDPYRWWLVSLQNFKMREALKWNQWKPNYYYETLSPDTSLLVGIEDTNSNNYFSLKVWDTVNAQPLWEKEEDYKPIFAAFSPDSKTLATLWNSSDGKLSLALWKARDGQPIWQFLYDWDITWQAISGEWDQLGTSAGMAFFPDGSQIAIGTTEGVRLVDASTGIETGLLKTAGKADWLTISDDGQMIATFSNSAGIRIIDVVEDTIISSHEAINWWRIGELAVNPDSRYLAVNNVSGDILLIDLVENRILGSVPGYVQPSFHPNGKSLVVVEDVISIYEIPELNKIADLPEHGFAAIFHPKGQSILVSTRTKGIIEYSYPGFEEIGRYKTRSRCYDMTFSFDQQWLICTEGKEISVFRTKDRIFWQKYNRPSPYNPPTMVSPIDNIFSSEAIISPGTNETEDIGFRLFDMNTLAMSGGLEWNENYWQSGIVAWSPDGKILVNEIYYHTLNSTSATKKGYWLQFLNAETFEILKEIPLIEQAYSATFTPDGRYLIFGDRGLIHILGVTPY